MGQAGQAAEKLTVRERFMRVGALAVAVAALVALGATVSGPPVTAKTAAAGVVVRPGVLRIAQDARAAPLTTAGDRKSVV